MCPDMLLGGPECGSQGFPAFTMAGLVVGVGVLGCEAGCAGGGFCAAAELVVDELGAVVFAGQAAFMGVVVGEGLSGLVDEQSQGLMSWSIRTVPVAASMIDISMMRPSRSVVSVSRMTPTPGSRSCSGIQWVVIVGLLWEVSGSGSGAIPAP